jgi:hypothetical protein
LFVIKAIRRTARPGRRLFLLVGRRNLPLRDAKFFLILLALFSASTVFADFGSIRLESDTDVSTAGFFQLTWNAPAQDKELELRESRHPDLSDYRSIYTGQDLARTMSGKPDGDYYYQIVSMKRDDPRESDIVKVKVAHHPLANAFMFFTLGAVVFLSILVSILLGNRDSKV